MHQYEEVFSGIEPEKIASVLKNREKAIKK